MQTTSKYDPYAHVKTDSLTAQVLGTHTKKTMIISNKERQFSMNVALISPPNVVTRVSKKETSKKDATFTTTTFFAILIEPPRGYGDVLDAATGTKRKAVIVPDSGGLKFDDANMSIRIPVTTKTEADHGYETLLVGKPFVCVANKAFPGLKSLNLYKLQISAVIWSDFSERAEFRVEGISDYDGFDGTRHVLELPTPWPARMIYVIYASSQNNPTPIPLIATHPEKEYSDKFDVDARRVCSSLWMMPMGQISTCLTDVLIRRGKRVIVYGMPASVVTEKSSSVPHLWSRQNDAQVNQTDYYSYKLDMFVKPELPRQFVLPATKDLTYVAEMYDLLPRTSALCTVGLAHDALRTHSVFSRDQNGEFYGNNSVFSVLLKKTPGAVLARIGIDKSIERPEEKDDVDMLAPIAEKKPKVVEVKYTLYSSAVAPLKKDINGHTPKAKSGRGSVLTHPLVGIVNAGFEIHAKDVAEALLILSKSYIDLVDTETPRKFSVDMERAHPPSMIFEPDVRTPPCWLNKIRDTSDDNEPLVYNVLECTENFAPLLEGEKEFNVYQYKKYTFFAVFQVDKDEGSPALALLRHVTAAEGRDGAKTLFGSLVKQIYKDGRVTAGLKYANFDLDSIFPPVVAPEQAWVGLFAIKTTWLYQNGLDVCDPNNENRMLDSVLASLYPPRPQASKDEVAAAVKKYQDEIKAIELLFADAKKDPPPKSDDNKKRGLDADAEKPEGKKQDVNGLNKDS